MCFFVPLQSMAQFKWHDGTVKNVHVDPTLLFDYQVCPNSLYTSVNFLMHIFVFDSRVKKLICRTAQWLFHRKF